MAINIEAGDRQGPGTWSAEENLTQSTATNVQSLSVTIPVSVLGMGTATGFDVNKYTLPTTAVEGFEKIIISNATGEAKVFIPTRSGRVNIIASSVFLPAATAVDAIWASATGRLVFQSDGDYVHVRMIDGSWDYLGAAGATLATST